jgi:AraC-like DNA-binding protein
LRHRAIEDDGVLKKLSAVAAAAAAGADVIAARAGMRGGTLQRAGFLRAKACRRGGLSERYVNELLYEAGASFSARLNELRLRKAADLLSRSGSRWISDVAFDRGFNDLSYFNRSFRRRFGLTPTAARGH